MFKNKEEEIKFVVEEQNRQIPDKLFELAMQCSFDAFMITTAEKGFPIVYINQAFTRITGYAQHECVGRSPSFLQGPKTDQAVLKRLSENIRSGTPFHGQAINYRKDGTEFMMEWKVIGYSNESGNVSHYIAIQKDVTANFK